MIDQNRELKLFEQSKSVAKPYKVVSVGLLGLSIAAMDRGGSGLEVMNSVGHGCDVSLKTLTACAVLGERAKEMGAKWLEKSTFLLAFCGFAETQKKPKAAGFRLTTKLFAVDKHSPAIRRTGWASGETYVVIEIWVARWSSGVTVAGTE